MEKEIHELLLAYLQDEISEEEMIRLQGTLDENERHRKLLDELRDKEVLRQEIGAYASFDTSRRWIQLKEEMDKTPRKRRLLLRVWKSVAAVFVAAVAGGLLYWQITDSARPVEEQVLVAQIRPGETQAVLITGKGQQLLLQGLKDTCLDITGNETLKISKDGSLEYSLSALSRMPEWHTLQVPRGGEYKIVLDDGTEIWLNSASELKYPAHFVGNERRVQLTGEAYFQVARMLYLKNLAVLNDMSFTSELEKMAIFLPDRKMLFQLIEGDKYGLNSRVEHEPDMRKEDTFSLIDAFLSNRNEEPEPKKEAPFLFQPSVSSDYMFWSLSKEEEEKPSGEDAENRLRHHDLIDSFIKNDQQRMPGSGLEIREENSRAETPESVKDLDDEQSKSLEDSCLTETLARIYIKQKRYDKALQIIKNLSLKYPEKNVYFADQIRFLEKLIINTKK